MRRANIIEKDTMDISTVESLTSVFESIASTHVAKVKNKVDLSREFFQLLWKRYSSIQINPDLLVTNRNQGDGDESRKVFVIISAEAGLSGDIDRRLIETMLQDYDDKTTDIIVLGTHGANQLTQLGISFTHYFQVPETDRYIDVGPVVDAILPYSQVLVYYEEYISLGVQDIQIIDLISRMRDMSQNVNSDEYTMTDQDTIFEPSLSDIAEQMEITMMTLALSQTILESSLAQAASRFSAMAVAKKRASDMLIDYRLEYYRSKRGESDHRLREVMVGLKKKRLHSGETR